MDNNKQTESVRISSDSMDKARLIKKATGLPLAIFIDQAVESKFKSLPKAVKEKILLIEPTVKF